MADKYASFSALARNTREDIDWRVVLHDRSSSLLVAAPHGGRAEPHTSAIARSVAGDRHGLYLFETLVPGLHITSHRFKEPRAVAQASRYFKVLTIHGCDNHRSKSVDVFVGGLDKTARNAVITELQRAGFNAAIDNFTKGWAHGNICNLGFSGAGVQLEISRRLRNRLGGALADKAKRRRFAGAVRRAFQKKTA